MSEVFTVATEALANHHHLLLAESIAVGEEGVEGEVSPSCATLCPSSVSTASCTSFLPPPPAPFLPFRGYLFLLSAGAVDGEAAQAAAVRLKGLIEELGGTLLEGVQEAAEVLQEGEGEGSVPLIVLCDALRRTVKCLYQMARGLLCVEVKWVERVAYERRAVPLDGFLLDRPPVSVSPFPEGPLISAERILSVRQRGCLRPLPLSTRLLASSDRLFVLLGRSQFVSQWTAVVQAAGGKVVQCRGKLKEPCVRGKKRGRGAREGKGGRVRPCAVHVGEDEGGKGERWGMGSGRRWVVVRDGGVEVPRCWEGVRAERGGEGMEEVPVSWLADCLIANHLLPAPSLPLISSTTAPAPLHQRNSASEGEGLGSGW